MKKIILFAIIIQCIACSTKENTPAIVSGVWDRSGTKSVNLYHIVSGRIDTLSTYLLQEDNTFGFAFNIQNEGFYVIGAGNSLAQQDKYIFYFKPGDALSLEVNDTTYVLTGKNTEENMAMANWQQYIHRLSFKSFYFYKTRSNYKDFFPLLEEYLQNPFVSKSTKNPVFNSLFEKYRTIDLINITSNFVNTPREVHPEKDDYPDFYRNINLPELTQDTYLLDYPYGSGLLSRLLIQQCKITGKNFREMSIEESFSEIKNDTLKGEILLQEAMDIKSYIGYTELMNKYGQYIVLPDQEKRASRIVAHLAKEDSKPGQPAINFTGKDSNDKVIALSDFKGKMVLVDIWATWCGPCILEMPYIEKLMQDYAGKDIVFMGVSVDVAKDKSKWKDFLQQKHLQGVQLFAGNGFESDIAKFYRVNSIPRFLLFDKKGNIISTDAPRPSSPEIRLMIDKGLFAN